MRRRIRKTDITTGKDYHDAGIGFCYWSLKDTLSPVVGLRAMRGIFNLPMFQSKVLGI